MSLQVERLEKNMAKLTVTMTAEELEGALQRAYLKNRKQISVPGFRKGKVPRQLIEKMYGPEIFYEDAVDELVGKGYSDALKECELELVSRPSISVTQIKKGEPFIFEAEVAVKPEVTLGEYKGVEIEKVDTAVTDEEIDAAIQKERENNARSITVEDRPVQDGDMITLDFEGFVDGVAFDGGKGTDYPLTIGSGSFIPGFEEKLIGAEIGKEVDVDVTFPEQYQAEELAGKPAVFKCTVHEIKCKELPELDDDFAQDVSEFDTFAEYKDSVKADLEKKKAEEAKAKKEDAVIKKIIDNAQMEIPDAMVQTQAENITDEFAQRLQMQGLSMEQYMQFTGATIESLVEQSKPQATQRIQSRLVLEAVAAAENLEATEEDVEAEYASMAEMYGMEVDKVKEYFAEGDLDNLKKDILVKKAADLVREAAVEVEKAAEAEA